MANGQTQLPQTVSVGGRTLTLATPQKAKPKVAATGGGLTPSSPWYVRVPYELAGYDPATVAEGRKLGEEGRKQGIVPGIVGTAEEAASGIPFMGQPLLKAMTEAGKGKYLPSAVHTGEAALYGLMGPGASEGLQEVVAPAKEMMPEAAQGLRKAGAATAERPSTAKTLLSRPVQKKIFQNWINAKGIDIANKLGDATKNVRQYIGDQAQKFVSAVDEKFPQGSIDASKVLNSTSKLWDELHSIEVTLPPQLKAVFDAEFEGNPEMKALKDASVFRGSSGVDVKEFLRAAPPQVRERLMRELGPEAEAATSPSGRLETEGSKWTAAQAKELRTKIGEMVEKVESMLSPGTEPRKLRAAAKVAYAGLSQQMREAAKATSDEALAGWENYNKATRNLERIDEAMVRPIRIAARKKGGEAVGRALGRDEGFVHESLKQLEKYGLNTKEVEDFAKIFRERSGSPGWKTSAMRAAYGTTAGLGAMAAAWGAGAGWLPRIAAGAAVGTLADRLKSGKAALALRDLPPELLKLIEERGIPGGTPVP